MHQLHPCVIELVEVNLSTQHLRASGLPRLRPLVKIAKAGIVTETADEMEAEVTDAFLERGCGEEGIYHYYVCDLSRILRAEEPSV